jgi:hypothetical protein
MVKKSPEGGTNPGSPPTRLTKLSGETGGGGERGWTANSRQSIFQFTMHRNVQGSYKKRSKELIENECFFSGALNGVLNYLK